MIELHSHILPGIDDGAKDVKESSLMLDCLCKQNIDTVVLTPHFYPADMSFKRFVERRNHAFAKLENAKKTEGINLIPASETLMSEILFNYDSIEELCIKGTNYLLLELPYTRKWSDRLFSKVDELMGKYGIIPLIAHVERYEPVRKDYKILNNLTELGCVLQMNTGSIISFMTRRFALKLMKKGFIDAAASDCHNMTTRKPEHMLAMEIVKKKLGAEYIDRFISNAKKIVNNEKIRSDGLILF